MSISYDSKNNLNNERIIEFNEINSRKAIDFILDSKENLCSFLHDSKNLIDKVNFPENWIMVFLKFID